MSIQNDNRLDYLDAVRASALILGIIFHASLSFMPMFIGWAVMDISTSDFIPVFALISHSFRMELFFLIAGFFSHMTFHNKGGQAFLKVRLVRIAIPFILGWFLLRPLVVSGWVMGTQSMRGEVDIWGSLVDGFASLGALPKDLLVGTHLWFLYYLLIISISVVLIRSVIALYKPAQNSLNQMSDSFVAFLCNSRLSILLLAVPTAGCLWFMNSWGMDTPDKSLLPHIPVTAIYTGFFLFGWLLHRQSSLIEQFARLTWDKYVVCLIAIIGTIILSTFQMKHGHAQYNLIKAGYMYCYATMMWSLVSITIGVCKRIFMKKSKLVRYIADSSYWLYLIHLPIVVWLQIVFAELPIHWSLKLVSICVVTIGLSLIMYELFVRTTFIGKALNGTRKPRYFSSDSDELAVIENKA